MRKVSFNLTGYLFRLPSVRTQKNITDNSQTNRKKNIIGDNQPEIPGENCQQLSLELDDEEGKFLQPFPISP